MKTIRLTVSEISSGNDAEAQYCMARHGDDNIPRPYFVGRGQNVTIAVLRQAHLMVLLLFSQKLLESRQLETNYSWIKVQYAKTSVNLKKSIIFLEWMLL